MATVQLALFAPFNAPARQCTSSKHSLFISPTFHGGKLIPRLHVPLALHRTTGRGLQACPAILTSTICIKLAGVGLLVFLFVGAVCAGFVGKVAPNPVRTYVSDGPNGYCLGTVMDAQGRTSLS